MQVELYFDETSGIMLFPYSWANKKELVNLWELNLQAQLRKNEFPINEFTKQKLIEINVYIEWIVAWSSRVK